jgi:hypothetical protein
MKDLASCSLIDCGAAWVAIGLFAFLMGMIAVDIVKDIARGIRMRREARERKAYLESHHEHES